MGPLGPDLDDDDEDWDDGYYEDPAEEMDLPSVMLIGVSGAIGCYLLWQVLKWLWSFMQFAIPH